MNTTLEVYKLPSYWASALVNGEFEGMEAKEANEIRSFLKKNDLKGCMVSCEGDPYFSWSNDANNMGADCLDYTFLAPLEMFDKSKLLVNERTQSEIIYRFNQHEKLTKAMQDIKTYLEEHKNNYKALNEDYPIDFDYLLSQIEDFVD